MPISRFFRGKSNPPSRPPRNSSSQAQSSQNNETSSGSNSGSSVSQQRSNRNQNSSTSQSRIRQNPRSSGSTSALGSGQVFRVTIPPGVMPGSDFQVYAGSRIVRVRCPNDSSPGQTLQITLPNDASANDHSSNQSGPQHPSNAPHQQQQQQAGSGNSPGVERMSNGYIVRVPPGISGGMQFPITIEGTQLMVSCPMGATEGNVVRIFPPRGSVNNSSNPSSNSNSGGGTVTQVNNTNNRSASRPERLRPAAPRVENNVQMFEVVVPNGVRGGQPFALIAAGQRVLVTCPPNAVPGQRIRFPLPVNLSPDKGRNSQSGPNSPDPKLFKDIELNYEGGWTRIILADINGEFKFQWVRAIDKQGAVDMNTRFCAKTSAYVRKINLIQPAEVENILTLVPACEALVDSRVVVDGVVVAGYSDIAQAQVKCFDDKRKWFQVICSELCVEWNQGHMKMNVRRDYLLDDSVRAILSLSPKELRKIWRLEFIGEEGIDAGGLMREWFQLVTEKVFNPDIGLFNFSSTNQMCMQINPASESKCVFVPHIIVLNYHASVIEHIPMILPSSLLLITVVHEEHKDYFRFLGRIMGKALFDQQLISGHMVCYLYKHILGWPVTFEDLQLVDQDVYSNMKKLLTLSEEELEYACLDFTVTENFMDQRRTVDLVPNGSNIDVTTENLPEYLEAMLKYRLIDRIKPQLTELLLGFFDVIPEPLMTIFDFQELELLMCGLPVIDIEDWRKNTLYTGEYRNTSGRNRWCQWFWEVVEEFDQELRARLLQFATGKFTALYFPTVPTQVRQISNL